MTSSIALASIVLGAVNAVGTILSIWYHCRQDIEKRAVQDARLTQLEEKVR